MSLFCFQRLPSSGTFAILMAGGVAGVASWVIATPMDVVKARLQMSGAGGRRYSGILHCIRVSVREEGVRVFFKGVLLNSVRAFPVNAITFLSYESLMKILCPSGVSAAAHGARSEKEPRWE